MSVWADALSWANAHTDEVTKNPEQADNIKILACQVTDLSILNSLRVAENYQKLYPQKSIYISGCLAERADIEFPPGVLRTPIMRENGQELSDRTLVHYQPPFWIQNFQESSDQLASGNLFRNKYPLRIGKGCSYNCSYCTIQIVRGKHEIYDHYAIDEFLKYDDFVLIADSLTSDQIYHWIDQAIRHKKTISLRNVEPQVTKKCAPAIISLAYHGLLDVFHSPIQSNNPEVLQDMCRNPEATKDSIGLASLLKVIGVKIATNIIIDYKDYPNQFDEIYQLYDYVSWNPYWDGIWDRKKAEVRFKHYFPWSKHEISTGNGEFPN